MIEMKITLAQTHIHWESKEKNIDIAKISFEGPEDTLNKTQNTQLAVLTESLAITKLLKYKEKNPASDPNKTMDAFKEAANEFYQETSKTVKEKAPDVMETVKEKANEAYEYAKEKAPEATAKAEELIGKAKEFVASLDETPIDGEVVEFEEPGEAAPEEEKPEEAEEPKDPEVETFQV